MVRERYAKLWREAVPQQGTIKKKIRAVLRNSALSLLSIYNPKIKPNFLRSIYCHYVFDDQKNKFEKIIITLKNMGDFISTDDFLKLLKEEKEIKGNYFHLSFDDGFRNIYTNAYPILLKHNIPAITFIPTKFIDVDWQTAKKYCIDIAGYASVVETLKWKDIQEMDSEGYEFGSHTRTHINLRTISENRDLLSYEIEGSKNDISEKINKPCKYFAWPFGELQHIDDRVIDFIGKAGYEGCFGAFRGSTQNGITNNLRLPRHHFEVEWPTSHIKYFARGKMELKL